MNSRSQSLDNPKVVGVYLGASMGVNLKFRQAVIALGEGLAKRGYTIVYGGASSGLMGVLAETVKSCGGKLIGVITSYLADKEILFNELDECIVVDSMRERKRLIHEKSSRFLVMPGGIGTFDEAFETWCNIKIGLIQKPIDFLNIDRFFDPLFHFMESCQNQGFLSNAQLNIPTRHSNVASYLTHLEVFQNQDENIEIIC